MRSHHAHARIVSVAKYIFPRGAKKTGAVTFYSPLRMAGVIPNDVVKVAESGVRGADDARSLHGAGYQAVLVGETLVTSSDPARAVADLIGE